MTLNIDYIDLDPITGEPVSGGVISGTFIGGMGDLMGAGAATTITNGTFLLAIP